MFKGKPIRLKNVIKARTLVIAVAVSAVVLVTSISMADWTGNDTDVYTMGNVGIGVDYSTGGYKLGVQNSSKLIAQVFTGTAGKSEITNLASTDRFFVTVFSDYSDNRYDYKSFFSQFCNGTFYPYFMTFSNGNIGKGTKSPSSIFDVAGTTTSTNYACSSDVRYKKDVSPYRNALQKVLGLQGVNYFWKTDEYKEKNFSKDRQIGFVAQEVEKVIPELVYTDDKGYKTMSYDRLTAVLVEAVKELKAQSDAKISVLEQENAELKQRLAKLDIVAERLAKLEKVVESTQFAQK